MANAPLSGEPKPRRTQAEALAVLGESLRYVDLREIDGRAGIALTWREPWDPLGKVRWVAIVDAPEDGNLAITRIHYPNEEPSDNWTGYHEMVCRNLICPGPRGADIIANAMTSPGYDMRQDVTAWEPLMAEVRVMARKAFETFDISDALRRLLHLSMDVGIYEDMPPLLRAVRGESGRPEWELSALTLTHPLLAKALMAERAFVRDLEGGRDYQDVFREIYPNLTDAHIKRLAGVGLDIVETKTEHYDAEIMRLCQMIPPEWIPAGEGWEPFSVIAHVMGGLKKEWGSIAPIPPALATCKGDWAGLLKRVKANRPKIGSWESSASWARSLARETVGFEDGQRHMANGLIGPLMMHEGVRRGLIVDGDGIDRLGFRLVGEYSFIGYKLLYGGKSLPGIFEASRRWHAREAAITAEIASANDTVTWPALMAPHHYMGMVALPVVTGLDLREEGASGPDRNGVPGLHHCVHTRLPDLIMGRAHILSIRRPLPDGGYERLSTLELRLQPDGCVIHYQHQAHRNFIPGVDAQAMSFELAEAFREGRIEILVAPRDLSTPDQTFNFDRHCGYAWRNCELLTNALRAWEPCLPRWMRGLTPAGAYDALVAHGLQEANWADNLPKDASLPTEGRPG